MKTIQLVFYEKVIKERDSSTPVTLEFQGRYLNDEDMPKITLKFTGCNEETAKVILGDLAIAAPGEILFLKKGTNPQKRLDDWFGKAERRKTSQKENFEKEIVDFDEAMLRERHNTIYDSLGTLVEEKKSDTKKFDFYLECLNVVREKVWPGMIPVTKEEIVSSAIEITTSEPEEESEDSDLEDNTGDLEDYVPDPADADDWE